MSSCKQQHTKSVTGVCALQPLYTVNTYTESRPVSNTHLLYSVESPSFLRAPVPTPLVIPTPTNSTKNTFHHIATYKYHSTQLTSPRVHPPQLQRHLSSGSGCSSYLCPSGTLLCFDISRINCTRQRPETLKPHLPLDTSGISTQ